MSTSSAKTRRHEAKHPGDAAGSLARRLFTFRSRRAWKRWADKARSLGMQDELLEIIRSADLDATLSAPRETFAEAKERIQGWSS